MNLYMPPHIFRLTTFRVPPKVEIGPDGKPRLVWVFNKCRWPFSKYGPVAKLKILSPLTARLKIAGTVSQLRQHGHLKAALHLLSTILSMEVLFIPLLQDMQVQVPVSMAVEGFQMRSGRDQMIVCCLRSSISVRIWAGLHLLGLCCHQDIQWAAGEIVSYNLNLGNRCTLSPDAGMDSLTNRRRRQIRPADYIQNAQGWGPTNCMMTTSRLPLVESMRAWRQISHSDTPHIRQELVKGLYNVYTGILETHQTTPEMLEDAVHSPLRILSHLPQRCPSPRDITTLNQPTPLLGLQLTTSWPRQPSTRLPSLLCLMMDLTLQTLRRSQVLTNSRMLIITVILNFKNLDSERTQGSFWSSFLENTHHILFCSMPQHLLPVHIIIIELVFFSRMDLTYQRC